MVSRVGRAPQRALVLKAIFGRTWPLSQEIYLRKWYNVGQPQEREHSRGDSDEVLLQTDSEPDEILWETDSEGQLEVDSGASQDEVLVETASEGDPEPPLKRRAYAKRDQAELTFLHRPVCRYAHQRLYGIGSGPISNLRQGLAPYTMHGEHRMREEKHPQLGVSLGRKGTYKWPNVLAFMWMLYNSCAEILPVKMAMPRKDGAFESYMASDPGFQDRYVRSYMANLERNYDLNLATWLTVN